MDRGASTTDSTEYSTVDGRFRHTPYDYITGVNFQYSFYSSNISCLHPLMHYERQIGAESQTRLGHHNLQCTNAQRCPFFIYRDGAHMQVRISFQIP